MPTRKDRIKSTLGDLSQTAKSAAETTTEGAKAVGDAATQKAKIVGETATQRAKAAGSAAAHSSEVAKDAAVQGAKSIGDTAARAGRVAGSATNQGIRIAGDGVGAITQRAPWDSVLPEQVRSNLADAIESSRTLSESAKRKLIAQLGPALDDLSKDGLVGKTQAFAIIQGLLASDQISRDINGWLQSLAEGSTTINVDATVAGYTETAASEVYFSESADYAEMMDTAYIETAASESYTLVNLEISRSWLNDLVSYDVVELVAGSIGILAVALNWNNDDIEEFSSIVSSIGLSAVVSANPLMLVVTVVALAKAFHTARKSGDWKEFSDGLAKGGVCTGAVLLATSLISGPTVIVLLSGVCVGILAHQATRNVSFVELGQFVIQRMGKDAKPALA